jgi:hypothetical protein
MSEYRNKDQEMESTERKEKGAFYTPKIWADEGHKEVERVLGGSWREDCLVWDCCAGTGNLTRDYKFNDLILTSLQDFEVEALKEEQGHSALVAQLDFLNDPIPSEIDQRLEQASKEGKRLVFLINPPYAGSGESGAKGGSKTGIAKSLIKDEMLARGLGKTANNLYPQFLYQCSEIAKKYGFKERCISAFTPISYMQSGTHKKFRGYLFADWEYKGGFLFQASHFEGLSPLWGISFIVWVEGSTDHQSELEIDIRDIVED